MHHIWLGNVIKRFVRKSGCALRQVSVHCPFNECASDREDSDKKELKLGETINYWLGRRVVTREIKLEITIETVEVLNRIILESGTMDKLLIDGQQRFAQGLLMETLNSWKFKHSFRDAYRPNRNGNVEKTIRQSSNGRMRGNFAS